MIRSLHRLLLPAISLGSFLWLTGCYTQVGTTQDERRYDEEYSATESDTTGDNYEQSYTDNYGEYDNEASGYRAGFDYYYPAFGFGFSTYDPWYWRQSGWYYYDPFVCGTYYPAVYSGYPYWQPHGTYFNPGYRYRTSYASGGGGRRGYGTTRTVGTTRGGGVVRGSGRDEGGSRGGSSGTVDLPTGYKASSGTRNNPPAATPSPRVSTGRKSSDAPRSGTRTNTGGRSGNTRTGSKEGSRSSQPRTYTPPPKENGADRGGSGRTYSPPATTPPQQSAPPSDAGRSVSSGGSRGGRSR